MRKSIIAGIDARKSTELNGVADEATAIPERGFIEDYQRQGLNG